MPERIKLADHSQDISLHFVINALNAAGKDAYEFFLEGFDREKRDVEITFQINGVDLPFLKTIGRIYELMSADVERKAAVLAGSKKTLQETIDLVNDIHDKLTRHMYDKLDPLRDGRLPDDYEG